MFGKNKKQSERTRQVPTTQRAQTYYYKHGKDDQDDVNVRPRRSRWWQNLPMYAATLVIAACILYSLLLGTSPKVVIVNDQDAAVQPFLRSSQSYQQIIQQQLQQSLLNKTKLTFDTQAVAKQVSEQLPEATEVSITLPIIGRNPVVYLRIAEPAFVMASESGSFVIDEQGRAVVAINELPDSEFAKALLVVADESGALIEVNKQAIPKEQVAFITQINQLLSDKNLVVKKMVLPATVNELHVYPDKTEYFVRYNFLLDVREQTGKYLAVKEQLAKEKSKPKSYIDVRVEDRAYVR